MTTNTLPTDMFIKHTDEYGRSYRLLQQYVADASYYLHLMSDKPVDICKDWVIKLLKSGKTDFKVPNIKALVRGKNGDRTLEVMPLTSYLNRVESEQYLLSPTMVAYVPAHKKKSLFADLMEMNIAKRDVAKGEKHAAKVKGDIVTEQFADVKQTTFKIKNNSLSGAHGSAFTPLFNLSAHSTLTSTCRSMTTTNNAHSERFIAGNRHYMTPSIAINNIIAIASDCDKEKVRNTLIKYNIKAPLPLDVYNGVLRSSRLYWNSDIAEAGIRKIIFKLSPEELAAFHYCGDLYQMLQVNPEFTRLMLDELAMEHNYDEDPDIDITKLGEEETVMLSSVFMEEVRGKKIDNIIKDEPELAKRMRCTLVGFYQVIEKYTDFFDTFLTTKHPPASIGNFTSSLRRCVPVSDTDSTVYTVQDWVIDRFDGLTFKPEARAYGAAVGYLNNKLTGHWLAMLSASMGVPHERQTQLVMKNEFSFPVIFMTGKAKHYAMLIDGCEGNFFADDDLELKGVSFRSSKIPAVIRNATKDMIIQVMNDVRDGKTIDGKAVLTKVADTERKIIASLGNGDIQYLPTAQVREKASYQNPMSSPYKYKELFDEVFGPKYGLAPEPPYQCIKVNVEWNNKTSFMKWVNELEDKSIGERLIKFLEKHGIGIPNNLLIPYDVAKTGIPKEVVKAIDHRRLVTNLMESAYLALESMGLYYSTPKNTVLISDSYPAMEE